MNLLNKKIMAKKKKRNITKGRFIMKQGEVYYMLIDWTTKDVLWTLEEKLAFVFTYREHAVDVMNHVTKDKSTQIIEL